MTKGAEPGGREESITREMPATSAATITDSGGLSAAKHSCLISIPPAAMLTTSELDLPIKCEQINHRSPRGLYNGRGIGPRRCGAPRFTDSSANGDPISQRKAAELAAAVEVAARFCVSQTRLLSSSQKGRNRVDAGQA